MDYRTVKKCRICKSENLKPYLDLGQAPPPNNLPSTPTKVKKYPLQVLYCEDCSLSQLSVVVDPEIMFSTYSYHSSVSKTFQEHCYQLGKKLLKMNVDKYPLVMDIASNDGCLLDQFRRAGFKRLHGIEPASNLTTTYHARQITFQNKFFGSHLAYPKGSHESEKCSVITATNVLAHVDDLEDFLTGVYRFLTPSGIFVAEFPHLYSLLLNNQFDTIYHEHLSYFLLKPLRSIFNRMGLNIFKVEQIPIHGGSLRIYASKDNRKGDGSVEFLEILEDAEGLFSYDTYLKYSEKIEDTKKQLVKLLDGARYMEKRVIGYGASAKGISLINYCGLTRRHINSIVDDTPDKQGKYVPGSDIPIVSRFLKPDYILLLAWNFQRELISKTKHLEAKYIVPIPEVKIL